MPVFGYDEEKARSDYDRTVGPGWYHMRIMDTDEGQGKAGTYWRFKFCGLAEPVFYADVYVSFSDSGGAHRTRKKFAEAMGWVSGENRELADCLYKEMAVKVKVDTYEGKDRMKVDFAGFAPLADLDSLLKEQQSEDIGAPPTVQHREEVLEPATGALTDAEIPF